MSSELQEGPGTDPGNASSDTIQQVNLLCQGELGHAEFKTIRWLAKKDPEGVLSALAHSESDSMPQALRQMVRQLQLEKARKTESLDHCIKLAHEHVSQFPDDVFAVQSFLRDVFLLQDEAHVEAVDSIVSMLPPTLTGLSYRALWASIWFRNRAPEAINQLREEIAALRQQYFVPQLKQDKGFAELVALASVARRIAIIGSGPSLQGAGQGAKIDAHDLVVRINCPLIGAFAEDVGSRTDVVFGWPSPTNPTFKARIARHESYQNALIVQATRSIKKHYTPFSNEDVAAAGVSRFTRLPSQIWNMVIDLSYRVPTTGFGAILFMALVLDRPVSLFGFDFYETGRQYFWRSMNTLHYGPAHEPRFEKRMVENMLKIHFGTV